MEIDLDLTDDFASYEGMGNRIIENPDLSIYTSQVADEVKIYHLKLEELDAL